MTQTLEQVRAKYALERIDKWFETDKNKKEKNANDYKQQLKSVTSSILHNGLGQTMAFYKGQNEDKAHRKIYDDVSEWLSFDGYEGQKLTPVFVKTPDFELIVSLSGCNRNLYMRAHEESLLFINWLAKLANALIQEESNNREE